MEREKKYPTFVNHVFKTDEFSFKTAHYHGDEVRTIQKKNYNLHHVFFQVIISTKFCKYWECSKAKSGKFEVDMYCITLTLRYKGW